MMPSNTQKQNRPTKKWTIMVFCAGDNALSPMIVSQLKDLKDAGSHEDVNVLVYFDANERGVPTRLYSINQTGHYGNARPCDTNVHNLMTDNVKISCHEESPAAKKFGRALANPSEPKAVDALRMFLAFCREQYSAEHYALVLVGHGMIVGNDAFLPDEFPDSSVTLKQLGKSMKGFNGKLELLALHSCSMSAIEVAYQLKGKAKYMIASEGPAYVQGWPYRKLLQRTFELLNNTYAQSGNGNGNGNGFHPSEELDCRQLVEQLYELSSSNGLDFMLSGYSQDLALINLDPDKFLPLTKAIKELVIQLKSALTDESCRAKQLIQLAHLESQSYYSESYTDLYDFCLCLHRSCEVESLNNLKAACKDVITALELKSSEDIERFDNIVVRSSHFGSLYQHSHGLSVYFPWTRPLGDLKGDVLERYSDYKFTKELEEDSWLSFLELYFEATKREARNPVDTNSVITGYGSGQLNQLSMLEREHKTSGASGATCTCISIKNFPTEIQNLKGKSCRMRRLAMSPDLEATINPAPVSAPQTTPAPAPV